MSDLTEQAFREARNYLQDVADEQGDLAEIPLALSRSLGRASLAPDIRSAAFQTIKGWVKYSKDNEVSASDLFAIRYHIPKFAGSLEIDKQPMFEPLSGVDASSICINGQSYLDLIEDKTPKDILCDPDVAIIGGAARLALKMYAGVDFSSELPINDVDAIISSKAKDVSGTAERYSIDLSGAKIVDGDIGQALGSMVGNFDCTMNQVGIYNGKLLYTNAALRDIKSGDIRLIAKNDPLFGSEGELMSDGNVYLSRNGFYRGLGFLLRNKGRSLIVSEENIELEKHNIGRYWQVLLYVKLLSMDNETARYDAIGHWHDVARRIGSTETDSPRDFLEELMLEYPNTSAGSGGSYDSVAQARWIIGKMIARGLDRLRDKKVFIPPTTYTSANISLSPSFPDYDYQPFMKCVNSTRERSR